MNQLPWVERMLDPYRTVLAPYTKTVGFTKTKYDIINLCSPTHLQEIISTEVKICNLNFDHIISFYQQPRHNRLTKCDACESNLGNLVTDSMAAAWYT